MSSQPSWPLLEDKPTLSSCGQLFTVSQRPEGLDNVNSAFEGERCAWYQEVICVVGSKISKTSRFSIADQISSSSHAEAFMQMYKHTWISPSLDTYGHIKVKFQLLWSYLTWVIDYYNSGYYNLDHIIIKSNNIIALCYYYYYYHYYQVT